MIKAVTDMASEKESEINSRSLFVKLALTEDKDAVIDLRKGLERALYMLMELAKDYGAMEDEVRAISIMLQSLEFAPSQIKL